MDSWERDNRRRCSPLKKKERGRFLQVCADGGSELSPEGRPAPLSPANSLFHVFTATELSVSL